MRILVSCTPFDSDKSGVSVYMRCLTDTLRAKGHALTIIQSAGYTKAFHGYQRILIPFYFRTPVLEILWHLFILPWMVRSAKYDLMILAAGNRRACLFYPIRTISVIHDLAEYHGHSAMNPLQSFYQKHILPHFAKKADRLAAVSQSTGTDLRNCWHVPPEKIRICYNGFAVYPSGGRGWCIRQHLARGKYIFYNSRIEYPLKNQKNLIAAYELLPEKIREEYTLVLAGPSGKNARTVHRYAEFSPDRAKIKFTGFIAHSDLQEAYSSAAVYLFPSFFEGFGFSLLAAMYYGVPCACSRTSSLGEIGKDAARLFDPEDPQSIAAAMLQILTEPDLRKKLSDAGKDRAREFTWEKHVDALLDGIPDPEKTGFPDEKTGTEISHG